MIEKEYVDVTINTSYKLKNVQLVTPNIKLQEKFILNLIHCDI